MREGETEFVERTFEALGHGVVEIARCEREFLEPLENVGEPELKRHLIGEQFVRVQERIIEARGLLDGHWILGQGTIYPDTIESGGTANAATIKTHHNRVPGMQKLMEAGRIVEPLADFYKDEVRAIGRELGLPASLLDRHPFPGPGLAIRCLCAEADEPVQRSRRAGWYRCVRWGCRAIRGVMRRCWRSIAFLRPRRRLQDEATELINRTAGINRVVARVAIAGAAGASAGVCERDYAWPAGVAEASRRDCAGDVPRVGIRRRRCGSFR